MNKDTFLKIGQVLGPVIGILIALVSLNFFRASLAGNDEAIGFGMLLPLYLVQVVPLFLIYTFTTAVTTFVLYKQKHNQDMFASEGAWNLLYKVNFSVALIGLALFGVPFLLSIFTFLTFLTFQ